MYEVLGELVEYWIGGGVTGIIANASTGEAPYLSDHERVEIIEFIKEKVGNRVNVFAGTGATSTWKTIELTKNALDAGAEAGKRNAEKQGSGFPGKTYRCGSNLPAGSQGRTVHSPGTGGFP